MVDAKGDWARAHESAQQDDGKDGSWVPGYNFPRLPLRALIPTGRDVHVIDRPRFLGLAEFGPRNVIYHEGRKYRMARCVLPPGGVESRMVQAKLCNSCGYFHDREHAKADRCDHCGTLLDGAHSQYIATLFEMGTVRGFRVERITCDEEERLREGFESKLDTVSPRHRMDVRSSSKQQHEIRKGAIYCN